MSGHTTYTFSEFSALTPAFEAARMPILLRGGTGIGKTQVVYQRASANNLPVIVFYAAQSTEGDITGLPSKDGIMINGKKATSFDPAAEIVRACTEPVVLFFDELDRGILEVRQAIFQIACERKYKGWELHPDTLVFAAVNGGLHRNAASFQVGEMDPAELSRWNAFDVSISTEDWLNWAKTHLHNTLLIDFIRQNPGHLMHTDEYEPNKKYPDPRSVARLDEVFFQAHLYDEPDYKNPAVSGKIFMMANAVCGQEFGIALRQHAATVDKQLTALDILEHGKVKETAEFGVNEHTALVDRIIKTGCFERPLTDKECLNIAKYFMVLPSEVAMFFLKSWNPAGADATVQKNQNNLKIMAIGRKNGCDVNMHLVKISGTNLKK